MWKPPRGHKIPKNRKPRYCPACGVGGMVKAGVKRKQQWRCRSCGILSQYPVLKK